MFSLIVAKSKNNVIGKGGEIPWYLPDDLKNFARLTRGHKVVMGRKTYESIIARIGKPLPDRENIVLTTQENFVALGCIVYNSIDSLLNKLAIKNDEEIFIIGGEKVYKDFLPLAQKIYLTQVETEISGDAFFPEFDTSKWIEINKVAHVKDEKHSLEFSFLELEKRN